MAEIKDVEPRTLAFIDGPFELELFEYITTESSYRKGERYVSALALTVRSKATNGLVLRVIVPKRDELYPRIEAMVIARPDIRLLNFNWDEKAGRVRISGALA